MPVYSHADVCNNLSRLLDEAKNNEEVIIKSRTGELFVIQLASQKGSAHKLPKLDFGLTRDEIVSYVREVRER